MLWFYLSPPNINVNVQCKTCVSNIYHIFLFIRSFDRTKNIENIKLCAITTYLNEMCFASKHTTFARPLQNFFYQTKGTRDIFLFWWCLHEFQVVASFEYSPSIPGQSLNVAKNYTRPYIYIPPTEYVGSQFIYYNFRFFSFGVIQKYFRYLCGFLCFYCHGEGWCAWLCTCLCSGCTVRELYPLWIQTMCTLGPLLQATVEELWVWFSWLFQSLSVIFSEDSIQGHTMWKFVSLHYIISSIERDQYSGVEPGCFPRYGCMLEA